ncbi:MAG: superoxide dismutase, Ni [Candidatus Hydrogenedentes bacterium]|nr:superoxide dismutase, Ni [Candidatus Hydrogenedentota bacterium]
MKTKMIATLALAAFALLPAQLASAHCQVPCGIYGDEARFATLEEHITTIEKAMNQITELSSAGDKNYNQIVRWVNAKELHADELTKIVTYYFLAQRIKPTADKYEAKLKALHGLMISAMKAKQTTDLAHVASLREGLSEFSTLYLGKAALAHLGEHHSSGDKAEAKLVLFDAEAGCASCIYKMKGISDCTAAVKVAGKIYLLEGADLDAHAAGLCKKALPAKVAGVAKGNTFVASAFELAGAK